jgi:hypothetical protein
VFFIGFNKCGTRSLAKYLSDSGAATYHGGVHIDSHVSILLNIVRRTPCLQGFDQFDAYLDVGAIQSQFRQLDRDYPGSKFVLNTRDVDHWIISRLNHVDGRYVQFMNLFYGVDLTWTEWADRWRTEFIEHHRAVTSHFESRPKDYLRFDIETDSIADLMAFLGVDYRAESLPREGVTGAPHYGLIGGRIVKL